MPWAAAAARAPADPAVRADADPAPDPHDPAEDIDENEDEDGDGDEGEEEGEDEDGNEDEDEDVDEGDGEDEDEDEGNDEEDEVAYLAPAVSPLDWRPSPDQPGLPYRYPVDRPPAGGGVVASAPTTAAQLLCCAAAVAVAAVLRSHLSRRERAVYAVDHVQQIFHHLRTREVYYMVSADYMHRQAQVTQKMRMILVDWLVDVHLKYKCRVETFFLTVNLIDRYLERQSVPKNKLQLLGCACMMAAAKYEEIYPPDAGDYVHISANTYTRTEMLQMEWSVLTVLEFSLTVPTLYPFLKRWQHACGDGDKALGHAALYLAKHCAVKYEMLRYPPSLQGAACVLLARRVLRRPQEWPSAAEQSSGYTEGDIAECLLTLEEWMRRVPTHKFQAIRKQFSHQTYSEAAKEFDRWAGRAEHVDATG